MLHLFGNVVEATESSSDTKAVPLIRTVPNRLNAKVFQISASQTIINITLSTFLAERYMADDEATGKIDGTAFIRLVTMFVKTFTKQFIQKHKLD